MRILQLLADWKWTGPAEPFLDLCTGLKNKGLEVFVGFKKPRPYKGSTLFLKAHERGIAPDLTPGFLPTDVISISNFIKKKEIDIVHAHLPTDHRVGFYSKYLAKFVLVRTNYHSEPHRPSNLFKKTDCYIRFSNRLLEEEMGKLKLPENKCFLANPGMDLSLYNGSIGNIRSNLGIGPDTFVIGVVMRIQKERRFELILDAAKLLSEKIKNFRILVMGRGTKIGELAVEPSKRMGIQNQFVFAGYIKEDYLAALNSIDVLLYSASGSDGTCRALREAMALGKPAVGLESGMIPEIITTDKTGFVVRNAQEMKNALLKLYSDRELRIKMGRSGRLKTEEEYQLETYVARMEKIYNKIALKS